MKIVDLFEPLKRKYQKRNIMLPSIKEEKNCDKNNIFPAAINYF